MGQENLRQNVDRRSNQLNYSYNTIIIFKLVIIVNVNRYAGGGGGGEQQCGVCVGFLHQNT